MKKMLMQQSSSFIARIIVSIISFVLSIIIVRSYSKEIVGDFFLLISYTTFLSQVFLFGMTPSLNILTASKVKLHQIFLELVKKLIISLPIMVITAFTLCWYFSWNRIEPVIYLTIISGTSLIITELMKGYGDFALSQFFNGGVSNIIFLLLLSIANKVIYKDILNEVIWLYIISAFVALMMNFLVFLYKYRKISCAEISFCKRIKIARVLPIYFSTMLVFLFSQIDLWVVSNLFPPSVVAQYGLSIRLAALISFSTLSVRAIAASRIPSLINSKKELQREVSLSCLFSMFISLLTLFFLLLCGRQLIEYMYGDGYSMSWYILLFFSVGQIVNAASGPCDYLLSHTGRGVILMWITFSSFLLLSIAFSFIYKFTDNNVLYYCGAVSSIVAIQNIAIVIYAYKTTKIISLPLIKRDLFCG